MNERIIADRFPLYSFIIGFFTSLFFSLGCSEVVGPLQNFTPNKAPFIISFEDNLAEGTMIKPGDTAILTVEASDPEGEKLHFEFSSADGSFSEQEDTKFGSTVTFHAGSHIIPLQPVSVKVTVRDDRKGKASQEIVLGDTAGGPALTSIGEVPVYIKSDEQVEFTFTANTSGLYQVQALDDPNPLANPDYSDLLANYYYAAESEVTVTIDGPDWPPEALKGDAQISSTAPDRVWVLLKDSLGSVGRVSFPLTFDRDPPVSTVDHADGYGATSPFQVVITASDAVSDVSRISYTLDRTSPPFSGNETVVMGNTATVTIGSNGYNTYVLKYRAMDNVGWEEDVKTATYKYVSGDVQAPVSTVNPTSPHISKSSFTVTISATDNLVGVKSISYTLDGGVLHVVNGDETTVNITDNGPHTLIYFATDNEGNVETPAKTANYTVDGIDPSSTVNPSDLHRSTTQFTVDISASDAHSGVSRIRYTLDGSDPETSPTAEVRYESSIQVTIGPGENAYELKYQAIDNAENVEDVQTAHYTIDLTPPGEVNLSIANDGSGNVTLNWTPPADSDLYQELVSWSPGGPTQDPVGKAVTSYPITGLTTGTEYTFTVQTRDTLGNTSTGVTVTITLPTQSMTVYAVRDAADLLTVSQTASRWNGYIALSDNIDLTGQTWTPIGKIGNDVYLFTGIFDGNGHTVTGLEMSDGDYSGLIAYARGATIRNTDVTTGVTGIQNAGSSSGVLVGVADQSTTISNCHVTGVLDASTSATAVGGFAGMLMDSTVTGCTADVVVTGGVSFIGGFVGNVSGGSITGCIALGSVITTGDCVGGVVGYASGNANFTGCRFSGTLQGGYGLGGIVGVCHYITVDKCRSTGSVTGSGYQVGGLVGAADNTTIQKCWATGDVQGTNDVGGLVGWISAQTGATLISDCYARGSVTHLYDESGLGGLLGYGIYPALTIENCYATGVVSQTGTDIGGLLGYIERPGGPMVTNCFFYQPPENAPAGGTYIVNWEDMLIKDTYTGWDFTSTWDIDVTRAINDGFPYLKDNHP